MHTSRFPVGTRVEIRRGAFPIDGDLLGKHGLIRELDDYRPRRYRVQLDEEDQTREFAEDELVPV